MEWGKEQSIGTYVNSFIDLSLLRQYKYNKGIGTYQLTIRSPFVASDYAYSQFKLESKNTFTVLKKAQIRSRIYAMLSIGNTPLESQLYLAGANGEQLISNKFTRAVGFIPFDWLGYNNTRISSFQYGGGLNIRGLAGYSTPESKNIDGKDSLVEFYRGTRGLSWNLEFEFDRFIKINAKGFTKNTKVNTYLFSDIGAIGKRIQQKEVWSSINYNLGLGFVFTQKFTPFDITPLVLRLDFPVYVNKVPIGEEHFAFRYLITVQKSF
jgi:aminopeptidase N